MCCSVSSSPLTQFVQKHSPFAPPEEQRKAAETDPLAALKEATGQTPADGATTSATGGSIAGYRAPGTGLLVDKLA